MLREEGYGAREERRASILAPVGGMRRDPHRGARGDGEKVNEVLANYGVFRITYVGQSRLLKRPFVENFNQRTIVIVVHRNGARVWRGESVIEFAGMHWGEARRARES